MKRFVRIVGEERNVPFTDVLALLAGTPQDVDVAEYILEGYLSDVRATLDCIFNNHDGDGLIRQRWTSLSPPVQMHLLLTPSFGGQLLRRPGSLCELEKTQVKEMLDAEYFVFEAPDQVGQTPVVSPLGDHAVHRLDGNIVRLSAPKIDGLVVLDFDGPELISTELAALGLEAIPLEARWDVFAVVLDAIETIDKRGDAYGALIRNFVRSIICRRSADAGFRWRTDRYYVGSVIFENADSVVDPNDLVDALIVGSVSSLTDMLHCSVPIVEDEPFAFTVSPRSKALVPITTFSQEVLASYALFKYYSSNQVLLRESERSETQRRNENGAIVISQAELRAPGVGSFTQYGLHVLDAAAQDVAADLQRLGCAREATCAPR
jgi:hypothetical protein